MMRNLLLILLLALSLNTSRAQSVFNTGSVNQIVRHLGGYMTDSLLRPPISNSVHYAPVVPLLGRIRTNKTTNQFQHHNGTKWVEFMEWDVAIDSMSNMRTAINSKTPSARKLTINGNQQAMTSDMTFSVGTLVASDTTGKWMDKNHPLFDGNYNSLSNTPNLGIYLTSETDPDWNASKPSYRTKAQNDVIYEPVITKGTAFNKNFGSGSGDVTQGNDTRVVNGNTAYSWGNHSLEGYLKSITGPMITSALGYTPVNPTRTINGYNLGSNISLAKSDVGLGNVDNTSDVNKPVSTLQSASIATKLTIPTGSAAQVLDGTGTPKTIKLPVPYSGTTNASGIYAYTYPVAYSVAPVLAVTPIGGNNKETQIVTSTNTGFSIKIELRSDVIGLLPTYSNVSGRVVNVIVLES